MPPNSSEPQLPLSPPDGVLQPSMYTSTKRPSRLIPELIELVENGI